ncbi:hypothetical protein [Enterovibrio calviensis]|uniref:hypothetical protein n=1 Tax=Enterovibrio calviensis TaxID=91359 RepID=UPI0037350986
MTTLTFIKNWTKQRTSFSFFLPTGSEGRPFDNQFSVEEVKAKDDCLIIALSDGIEFSFKGNVSYKDEGCNLILFDFTSMSLSSNGVIEKEFYTGEFCLSGF